MKPPMRMKQGKYVMIKIWRGSEGHWIVYETYREVIEASNVKKIVTNEVPFEIFGEDLKSRLVSVTIGL